MIINTLMILLFINMSSVNILARQLLFDTIIIRIVWSEKGPCGVKLAFFSWFCLLDLILYVLVNDFSVMSGRVFLG